MNNSVYEKLMGSTYGSFLAWWIVEDAKLEEFDFKKVNHSSLSKKDDGLYYIPDFDLPFQGEAIIRSWEKNTIIGMILRQ